MNDVSEDDSPWPFIEPSEDPRTCKDSIYCDVFGEYFHPTSKQKIKLNHPMVSRIVECYCKLHLVLLGSDSDSEYEDAEHKDTEHKDTEHKKEESDKEKEDQKQAEL